MRVRKLPGKWLVIAISVGVLLAAFVAFDIAVGGVFPP
jgi:hypothetical protein